MIGIEDWDPVKQVGGLVRGAAPDVDPARGLRPQRYFAAAEGFEAVRLGEKRVVAYCNGRDLAVGERGPRSEIEAADRHRRAHIDRMDADRLGEQPDIDLQ